MMLLVFIVISVLLQSGISKLSVRCTVWRSQRQKQPSLRRRFLRRMSMETGSWREKLFISQLWVCSDPPGSRFHIHRHRDAFSWLSCARVYLRMLRLRRKEPDTCWSSTTSAWTWQDPLTSLQPTPDPAPSSESKVRGHFSPYFLNDGQNVSDTEEAPCRLAEAHTNSSPGFCHTRVSHVSVSVQPIRACGYFHHFSLYLKAGCSLIGGAVTWNTNQTTGSPASARRFICWRS